MMYSLKELFEQADSLQAKINDKWVPCRPLSGPFTWRVRAAWAVLTGRADAFTWPEGQ